MTKPPTRQTHLCYDLRTSPTKQLSLTDPPSSRMTAKQRDARSMPVLLQRRIIALQAFLHILWFGQRRPWRPLTRMGMARSSGDVEWSSYSRLVQSKGLKGKIRGLRLRFVSRNFLFITLGSPSFNKKVCVVLFILELFCLLVACLLFLQSRATVLVNQVFDDRPTTTGNVWSDTSVPARRTNVQFAILPHTQLSRPTHHNVPSNFPTITNLPRRRALTRCY